MIWRPLVFLAALSLTSGLSAAVMPSADSSEEINAAASFNPSGYTDLLSEDVNFAFSVTGRSYSDDYQSFTIQFKDTGEENYVLGNYDENSNYYPLTYHYTVNLVGGGTEERDTISSLQNGNYTYDAIGDSFAAETTFKCYADLPIAKGETIASDSLIIYNVFHVAENKVVNDGVTSYTYTPEYGKNYYLHGPTVTAAARTNYYLGDFVTSKSLSLVSDFDGYTSLSLEYTVDIRSQFKNLSSSYQTYEKQITDGSYSIRQRLTSFTNSKFRINYNDGTSDVRTITGTSFVNFLDKGTFRFLLDGVDSSKVTSFDILNASVYSDIWDNSKNVILTKSGLTWRFGCISFAPVNAGLAPTLNYNVTMIVGVIIFLVLFAAYAVGMYFYKKKKYKNDEFNRVIPKEYVKKSTRDGLYLGSLTVFILCLVGRCVYFANSNTVYNPFDPYIMAFIVILLIFTGYYIKYFVNKYKDHKIKKMEEKLKLAEDVEDDGTVVTQK